MADDNVISLQDAKKRLAGRRKPVAYSEPPSRTTIGWTPAKLKTAELQAENGTLQLAADVVASMRGDDRFCGVLETLGGVASLPMLFESGSRGIKSEKDPACQALAEGDWWALLPEQMQAEIIAWGRTLGVALGCISEWRIDEQTGRALPVVELWSPRWLRWIDADNEWEIQTSEGRVRTKGGDGTWLIFSAYRTGKGWMAAPWRGLARFWLLKQCGIVDWADDGDRHAQGKRVVERKDYGASSDGTPNFAPLSHAEADELSRNIHALGRSGTIFIPDGYGLSLLETSGKGSDIYQQQITAANTSFAVTMLGQNLTTEVQAGSYASTSVHNLVKADRLQSVASWLETCVHEQLLPYYVEYNFTGVRTPWAKYDTKPPSDKQAEGQRFAAVASAIKTFAEAEVPLDIPGLQERFDLPIDVAEWKRLQTEKAKMRKAQEAAAAKPPKPDEQEDDEDETEEAMRSNSLLVDHRALAIRAQSDADDQLDQGSEYVDGLEEAAKAKAVKIMRPGVDQLVELVKAAGAEEAETEDQRRAVLKRLRASVLDAFDELDPVLYAETIERVEMLASMAGAYSAVGEV